MKLESFPAKTEICTPDPQVSEGLMNRFQIPLAGLIVAVALTALGLAALIHADPLSELAVLACTVGILLISAVLALIRRGENRLFWAGFAVAGWGYAILLCLVRTYGWWLPAWWGDIRSFPTTRLLIYAYEHLVGNPAARYGAPYGEEFVFIGQYLFTLLFGCVGGFLTRALLWPATSPAAPNPAIRV